MHGPFFTNMLVLALEAHLARTARYNANLAYIHRLILHEIQIAPRILSRLLLLRISHVSATSTGYLISETLRPILGSLMIHVNLIAV